MNKSKKYFLIFSLAVAFFCTASYILAQQMPTQIELVYPQLVSGIEAPRSTRIFLPSYIRYVYTFAIASGGILSLLSLLYGGFRFLTSTGNPGVMADAKDQIVAGILGLLIIFGSWVFLTEINPQTTQLTLPGVVPARRGIIIYNDNNCGNGMGNGIPELVDLPRDIHYYLVSETTGDLTDPQLPAGGGYDIRSFFTFHGSGQISVYFYNDAQCEGQYIDVGNISSFDPNTCVTLQNPALNVHCVRIIWRLPGVWLFAYPWGNPLEPGRDFVHNTTNRPYLHTQVSLDSLERPFNDNIQSIGLVAPKDVTGLTRMKYGVILHNVSGGMMSERGWSEVYLPDSDPEVDITVYNLEGNHRGVSSVTVFTLPPEHGPGPEPIQICRNPRCDQEYDNNRQEYVHPALRIGWQQNNPDITLEDLTAHLCVERANNGRSINSSQQNQALQDPRNWNRVNCAGYSQIVGGARIGNDNNFWRNADDYSVRLDWLGQIPANARQNGVSAIYLPEGESLICLLFYVPQQNHAPLTLAVRSSEGNVWRPAAVINSSVPDLSTIKWNDRLSTIIVIRTLPP